MSWSRWSLLALSSLLLSAASSTPLISAVEHIHYVDSNSDQSIFLFRGGTPVSDPSPSSSSSSQPQVEYNQWLSDLQTSASLSNLTLPPPIYLIDINLMNYETNRDITETLIEFDFFQQNPDKGRFVFWSTVGTLGNISNPLFGISQQHTTPISLSPYLQDVLLDAVMSYLPDRMTERQAMLWDLIHNPDNLWIREIREQYPEVQSIVVYGHCDCGCDRTGQTFGAYYLEHLEWSWKRVIAKNTEIAGRGMSCNNYLALQFYCFYLNVVKGYENECEVNYECSSWWPVGPNAVLGGGSRCGGGGGGKGKEGMERKEVVQK